MTRLFWIKVAYILIIIVLTAFETALGQKTKPLQKKTVVIDAGHGGKDPGTIVGSAKEKNIVLDVALKLGKLIRQNPGNIKAVLTRDGDYYIPLMDRAQIANRVNADLFISIHANYCNNPEVYGTETYVLGLHRTEDNLNVAKKENSVILLEEDYSRRYEGFNPNLSESYIMFELIQDTHLDQSLRFASILQTNFKELARRHDRDVRQAGFLVLRETSMPSVLVETGYLSNKKENSYLLTDEGRASIAQSIYDSLKGFLSKEGLSDLESENSIENVEPSNDQKTERKKNTDQQSTKIRSLQSKDQNPKLGSNKSSESNKHNAYEQLPPPHTTKSFGTNQTTYAIQIGVYSKKIEQTAKVFHEISPIKEIIVDGRFKYFCCESDTFTVTMTCFTKIEKLFPDAFLVKISNNKISLVNNKPKH